MTFWWTALEIISPTPAGVFQGLYLIYSFVFSKREVFLNGIKLQIIFDKVSRMKINLYSNNLVCINFVDNVNFLPLRDYTVDISGVSPSQIKSLVIGLSVFLEEDYCFGQQMKKKHNKLRKDPHECMNHNLKEEEEQTAF